MFVLPPEPCRCLLPWGEPIATAVARHLPEVPDGMDQLPCVDLHPLAKYLGGASFVAMSDRQLHAEMGDRLPRREILTAPREPGAPRWFVYTIYTALGIVMLVTCALMGVLP